MSEPKHIPAGTISVHADDDGRVWCGICNAQLDRSDLGLLVNWPGTETWSAVCKPCTGDIAHVLTGGLRGGWDSLIVQAKNP